MEKLQILRRPIGLRSPCYASLDDIAIWGVLALNLIRWARVGRQAGGLHRYPRRRFDPVPPVDGPLQERDRWYAGPIWIAACGLGADWAGLHYMVGAFIAGAVMDAGWIDQRQVDWLRHNVLLMIMPVFFLSTGLRTIWQIGGAAVFLVAAVLLVSRWLAS